MSLQKAKEELGKLEAKAAELQSRQEQTKAHVAALESQRRPLVTAAFVNGDAGAKKKLAAFDEDLKEARQEVADLETAAGDVATLIISAQREVAAAERQQKIQALEELRHGWVEAAAKVEEAVHRDLIPALRQIDAISGSMNRLMRELGRDSSLRIHIFDGAVAYTNYCLTKTFPVPPGVQERVFTHRNGEDLATELSGRGERIISRAIAKLAGNQTEEHEQAAD